jgi:hypothetical protein
MVSPAPGTTLSGASQLFTWTAAGSATGYAIYAGSTMGGYDYYASLVGGTSQNVTGLPTNGSTVWVRLWTNFASGWQLRDYSYTAGSNSAATMTSPVPGTTLAGASQFFAWTTATGATGYAIYAGSSAGAYNYYASLTGGTSQNVTGFPTNGSTVWIRLWTNSASGWTFIDYPYTASSGGGGSAATMMSPVPDTTLAGASQLFTWTTSAGATGYAIYAGSSVGSYNYYASLAGGTSQNVTGLPTNGSTVWIRLWTNSGSGWTFIDYSYTASNGGAGAAVMLNPAPGTHLPGGTTNFSWNAVAGATGYALYVGSSPGTFQYYGALVAGTSQSVPGVPASGPIWVRLWTNFPGGWLFNDYLYS